ncbi:MAG: DUF3368 domain-containing protein, partial [Anaerolineales bacterium]|nr:DUF3368 domain-containing protein [Anaerolineales bacterium]
ALGIAISGTLGLLLKATQAELITAEEADGLLTQMLQNGYRSPHFRDQRITVNVMVVIGFRQDPMVALLNSSLLHRRQEHLLNYLKQQRCNRRLCRRRFDQP